MVFMGIPFSVRKVENLLHDGGQLADAAELLFGVTEMLSIKISASLALPKRPGLPIVFGVRSAASMVQSAGSSSPFGQTLPRSTTRSSLFSLWNLSVYQVFASQANLMVLAKRSSSRGVQERT